MKRVWKLCVIGLVLISMAGCNQREGKDEIESLSQKTNAETVDPAESISEVETGLSSQKKSTESENVTESGRETETTSASAKKNLESENVGEDLVKIQESEIMEIVRQLESKGESVEPEFIEEEIGNNAKQEYMESIQYVYDLATSLSKAISQTDLNIGAGELYEAWDYELNRIYGLLENSLSKEQMEMLTIRQMHWIENKENKIEEEGQKYAGGTVVPLMKCITGAQLTEEKTLELIDMYFGEITAQEKNISARIKDYIRNGQGDKSEAQKCKWSETFLETLDIDAMYKQYLIATGEGDTIEGFASYMTEYAPIPSTWETMVKEEILADYGEEVTRFVYLENDLYQVYIQKDGDELPYVVVSSRTGYYHG